MRPILLAVALAALAYPALAQETPGARAGLRYLDWPGKAPQPAPSTAPRQGQKTVLRPLQRPIESATASPGRYSPASTTYGPAGVYDPPAPPPTPMISRAVTEAAAQVAPVAAAPAQVAAIREAAPAPKADAVPAARTTSALDRPRVYSLHRPYGEQPDHTELPAPVFLDGPPVDLAAPPPQDPARDKNGKPMRADHTNNDPSEP